MTDSGFSRSRGSAGYVEFLFYDISIGAKSHVDIRQKIYAHLDNGTKRNHDGEELEPKSSEPKLKNKAYGHDSWRKENPEAYQEALEAWKEEQDREPNIGEARAVSSAEFKKLPEEEQKKWTAKAKAALKASRALAKITNPEERAK